MAPAAAQNIYRCGDSYSQQPCPGGTVVEAEDERSAAQRSQTSQAAQRDAKTADAMEKARLKEEAKPAGRPISRPRRRRSRMPQRTPSTRLRHAKRRKPAYFTAVAPRKPGDAKKKTKKKAN